MILDSKQENDLSKIQGPQGIIQLLSNFQEEDSECTMQAESILSFISDILDFSKSPQADAFNLLFNNMDVYYVFKMRLPLFISSNSPHKMKAIKLMHQYI